MKRPANGVADLHDGAAGGDGAIPDVDEAAASPRRLSNDRLIALSRS
jgi:hypothetical protein